MSRKENITHILQAQLLSPEIHIEDESSQHAHGGNESHLKVFIVSKSFEGQSRIQRQRGIHQLLNAEFQNGLHALSLRCMTPAEAEKSESDFLSPACVSKN